MRIVWTEQQVVLAFEKIAIVVTLSRHSVDNSSNAISLYYANMTK